MMKKISILCTFALLLMASCSREQGFDDRIDHSSEDEFQPQGGVTFTASLEGTDSASDGTDEDGTRTSLSGTKVLWNKGDAVKIFWNGGSVATTALESGSTTDFSAEVNMAASAWYAVYPASLSASYSDASGFSVTVPAAQDGSFEKANIMVSTTTGTNFPFKNLCGLMKFSIANTSVRTIIIRSMNNNVALAGTLPITFSSGTPVPGAATSTSTAITLSVSGAGTYYAAFLPGANMSAGFYIELQDGDGKLIPGVIGSNALTMTRSRVKDLGSLDSKMRLDWFVTPSGAGTQDGSSWENALSWSDFTGWVNTSDATYPLPAKVARISGSTFNFKEGTYTASGQTWLSFSDNGKVIPIRLVGGYASSSTGTSKASRTPRTTIFTSSSATDRLFKILNWIDLRVDGIKFAGLTTTEGTGGGAAFYLGGNTSKPSSLTCTDCEFYNNQATSNNGGALYISDGALSLNDCLLEGNSSANASGSAFGGAVFVRHEVSTNTSPVLISGCTFTGNQTNNQGGAIYLQYLTTATVISDCTFTGNHQDNDHKWGNSGGGAVSISPLVSGSGPVTFEDCTFEGNYASSYGGAVNIKTWTGSWTATTRIYARNCLFKDNWSQYNGGAWAGGGRHWDSGSSTDGACHSRSYFDGCIFTGNYMKNAQDIQCTGHAIGYNQGWIALNNCAFYDNGTAAGAASTNSSDIAFEANKDNYTGCKSVVLMTNTTIVSPSNAAAALYICMSDAYVNMANCLVVCPANAVVLGTPRSEATGRNAVFASPTAGQYNVLSFSSNSPAEEKNFYKRYCDGNHSQAVALANYSTWTSKFTDGYKFNGTGLNLDSYVTSATTLYNFCTPLTASAVSYDVGSEFQAFVGDNFGKDISGATRSGNFTPGCWQVK